MEYKIDFYNNLAKKKGIIVEKAKQIPKKIGMPSHIAGNVGLTGTISGNHGLIKKKVADAMEYGARKPIANSVLDFKLRRVVKQVYGDEWDALAIGTCEAALMMSFDVLCSPPIMGRGDNYRARYLAPYERHLHHQGSYGRPFPPKYKDIFADRGVAAGEYGLGGKRLNNLETVYVPLVGAKYVCHGIKYHPCCLLYDVDGAASVKVFEDVAEKNYVYLSGITSLGYRSNGYGYRDKDEDGLPKLQKGLGALAQKYNIPYIVDNAKGVPFIGTDPRKINADLILYSMDKTAGAPTCGLIIGKEEPMIQIRRAMGVGGNRDGSLTSYGKAAYVTLDPGKEALLGLIASLECIIEDPGCITEASDDFYEIIKEEFGKINPKAIEGAEIFKSDNEYNTEVCFQHTWDRKKFGFPIFSIEDFYAGSNFLTVGMGAMNIFGGAPYDGNFGFSPGLGTTDENGRIIEENARWAIRAAAHLTELIAEEAGIID